MDTTRVVLLEMKPRLHDILVDAIGRDQTLELVATGAGPLVLSASPAPVVLVREAADPLDFVLPTHLLGTCLGSGVLLIADSGIQAALYELRLMRRILPNVSIGQLLDAIRHGFERGGRPDGIH